MPRNTKSVRLKTVLIKSPDSGWHYLVVEPATADKLTFTGKTKRVVCTINDGEPFRCALMPLSGVFYVLVNKKKREALGIAASDEVRVKLEVDESKYGLPMPEEFQEVLNQDPEGDRLFHHLTAGKQRSLIYHVSNHKNIDRRIHDALLIIDHIKRNEGKVIDRELYEELRRPIF